MGDSSEEHSKTSYFSHGILSDADFDDNLRRLSEVLEEEHEVEEITQGRSVIIQRIKQNSTLLTFCNLMQVNSGYTLLVMGNALTRSGYLFGISFFMVTLTYVAASNAKTIVLSDYLSVREGAAIKTLDQLAYVAFLTCSEKTRRYAKFVRHYVNAVLTLSTLDACVILLIIIGRGVRSMMLNFLACTLYHVICMLLPILSMLCCVEKDAYIPVVSTIAFIGFWLGVFLSSKFLLIGFKNPFHEELITNFSEISEYFGLIMISTSGLSSTLRFKSTMKQPQHLLRVPGVLCFVVLLMAIAYTSYGTIAFVKQEKDYADLFIHLHLNDHLALASKIVFMLSLCFHYIANHRYAYNIVWMNYLKRRFGDSLLHKCIARVVLVLWTCMIALLLPDFGHMQIMKGAVFHSNLEFLIPATIDYVAFRSEEHKRCSHIWTLCIYVCRMIFGFYLLFITGTFGAIGITKIISDVYPQMYGWEKV